jgi:hypothetical protein
MNEGQGDDHFGLRFFVLGHSVTLLKTLPGRIAPSSSPLYGSFRVFGS